MLPRAHRAPAVAVLALTTLLASGCSGSSSGDAGSSAASTSSASQSSTPATQGASAAPTTTVETPPAAPRAKRGAAGQKAFAQHVMALWAYALRTNDAKPLSALGPGARPCGGCAPLAATLKKRAAQGWTVDFAGLRVHRITTSKDGKVVVARATVDVPQSDSYNTDGTYRNTSPAHPGARFEVRMRLTGNAYQLVSFTLA